MADIDTSKEAMEKLLDGVTDGPWTDSPREIADADDYSVDRQEDGDDGLCYSAVGVKGGQTVAIVVVPMSFGMDREQIANARLIAWCREGVPALSRDLEAMRGERDALRARVAELEGSLSQMVKAFDEHIAIPDEGCCCHISPPCNDCVTWSFARDAMKAQVRDDVLEQAAQEIEAVTDWDYATQNDVAAAIRAMKGGA